MSSLKSSDLAALAPALSGGLSVRSTIVFAVDFFKRNWRRLIAAAWLPLFFAAAILYFSLDGYLSGLERYQGAPNSKIAGVALAELAAGIFASLFLYSMIVVSVVDMLNGRPLPAKWVHFRAQGREWRLFAGYLKFSVGVVTIFALLGGSAAFNIKLIPLWLFMPLGMAASYALYVRAAFLFPALLSGRGPIVRRAWLLSAAWPWRIALIVFLLSLPGLAAEMVSEFVLRLLGMADGLVTAASLADYAPRMRQALPGFLTAITVWTFFNLTLLTAGSVSVCRALSWERDEIIG